MKKHALESQSAKLELRTALLAARIRLKSIKGAVRTEYNYYVVEIEFCGVIHSVVQGKYLSENYLTRKAYRNIVF